MHDGIRLVSVGVTMDADIRRPPQQRAGQGRACARSDGLTACASDGLPVEWYDQCDNMT